jgi:hypothetical protein
MSQENEGDTVSPVEIKMAEECYSRPSTAQASRGKASNLITCVSRSERNRGKRLLAQRLLSLALDLE